MNEVLICLFSNVRGVDLQTRQLVVLRPGIHYGRWYKDSERWQIRQDGRFYEVERSYVNRQPVGVRTKTGLAPGRPDVTRYTSDYWSK